MSTIRTRTYSDYGNNVQCLVASMPCTAARPDQSATPPTVSQVALWFFPPALSNSPPSADGGNGGKTGMSTGGKIGVGVGVPVIAILIGVVIYLHFVLKRRGQFKREGDFVYVGSYDAVDLVRDSINMFQSGGRVGSEGDTSCLGWGLYGSWGWSLHGVWWGVWHT